MSNDQFIPSETAEAELIEKNSRFIGLVFPVSNDAVIRPELEKLRTAHPKANHVVWASRLAGELHPAEGFSDDGEPSGTAGMPVLKQLQHDALLNCLVCVVRYFGGTKLGTGGLQRAYSRSARMALTALADAGALRSYQPQYNARIACSFQDQSDIRHLLSQMNIRVCDEGFTTEGVILTIEGDRPSLNRLRDSIGTLFHKAEFHEAEFQNAEF